METKLQMKIKTINFLRLMVEENFETIKEESKKLSNWGGCGVVVLGEAQNENDFSGVLIVKTKFPKQVSWLFYKLMEALREDIGINPLDFETAAKRAIEYKKNNAEPKSRKESDEYVKNMLSFILLVL